MNELQGRVILVTGASRGIGRAIAQALGRQGARLALLARHRKDLARAQAQVPGAELLLAADVTQPGDVARALARLRQHFRRLDVLVNNAGVFTYKPFLRTTQRDWRRNIETNLSSIFHVSQAAIPLLSRSPAPHLVNILSISSLEAFSHCAAYTASKFGALGLTRVLRQEFPRIRVSAIFPGSTNTRMKDEFGFPIRGQDLIQPDDVAAAVLAALVQPRRTTVEEILLRPSAGRVSGPSESRT
jgi:NAD(P)-dependent dehydrogenase (short-subunit alcohol dehydrogenase family)